MTTATATASTTNDPWTITHDEKMEIARQVGPSLMAISGGKVYALPDGISMPCGNGYRVNVRLTSADDYTVERVFRRMGKEYLHGTRDRVYMDTLSEVAYYASCYRSYDAAEWVTKD